MLKFIRRLIPDHARLPLISMFFTQMLTYFATKYINVFETVDMSIPLDRRIAVQPVWVVVYILAYVYWAAAYVAVARVSKERCMRLFRADLAAKVLTAALFVLMPTAIERPEIIGGGIFDSLLGFIYILDTPRNLFPSMHCMFSWLAARELMSISEYDAVVRAAAFGFSILVFLSTLFTRQHYIADIFGGVAVAEIGMLAAVLTGKRRLHGGKRRDFKR